MRRTLRPHAKDEKESACPNERTGPTWRSCPACPPMSRAADEQHEHAKLKASCTGLSLRLVPMGLEGRREGPSTAPREAIGRREGERGRRHSRPARAGDIAPLSPALARASGREGGEREARGGRHTDGARVRRARVRWRDVIGPCVPRGLAVFYRLESKKFEKNYKKSQISFPIHL
jgi:hypothetical protein